MTEINVLSLFDGISCGYEALKRANIKVDKYFASEIDKYAIQVSSKNHPDIIQLGDIKELDTTTLPKIDLLIGGSPCQGFSNAGKRLNFYDPRSKLFFRYIEILKQVKPKYFLLENVRMKKEWCDIITEHVGVEPILINSSLVSGQSRKRLYWTNIEGITQPEDKGIMLRDVLEPQVDEKYYVKPKSNTVRSSGRGSGINDRHNWDSIKLYNLGNGGQAQRVYSIDGKSTSLNALGGGQGAKTGLYAIAQRGRYNSFGKIEQQLEISGEEKSNCLTCVQKDSMVLLVDGEVRIKQATKLGYIVPNDFDGVDISYPTSQTRRGRVIREKASCITCNEPPSVYYHSIIRKLTPLECERLQTLPDGYTDVGISNTQRYKCIGNAWTVDVIAHIFGFIDEE